MSIGPNQKAPIVPHLVQRGRILNVRKKDVTGIDALVKYDYMRSAEFEFGALGKSLKRVVSSINTYQVGESKVLDGKESLWAIAPGAILQEVTQVVLPGMCRGSYRLKERSGLPDCLTKKDETWTINFWWDIGNDWMAATTRDHANLVLLAFQKVQERWGKLP